MIDPASHPEVSLPTLLRVARRTYGSAIRHALSKAGFDDIPESGLFVIGAITIAPSGAPLSRLIRGLGVSKQVAGQLIDVLVLRGYARRDVDPDDRRRLTVVASERGQAAARVIRTVIEHIEAELIERVGAQALVQTRATLLALIASRDQHS